MTRRVAIGLLACLALLVLVHRVLVEAPQHHGFESFDATEYFQPAAAYLHDSLREGRLPVWNPYQLAGQPFLALHVPGALYPPNLLVIGLLDPAWALALLAALHLWIAATFTWLFATRLGLGTASAFATATSYMLCGSLVFGIYNPAYLATMAWLPALLWSVHGLCSEARWRFAAALALVLALAFLGGHSQGFVYALQLALPYGVFALFAVTPSGRRVRVVLLAATSGLLAAGLVAPQSLPTLELQRQAVRSLEGHRFAEATFASYTPARVLQGLLGQPAPESPSRPLGPLRWAAAWPALGLPLLFCGLWARAQRAHFAFFVIATLAAALFVLGRHTSAYSLYYALPFGDLFRAPIRLAFVYSFCVAVCAGLGVEGVAQRLRTRRTRIAVALPAGLAALLTLGLYLRSDLVSTHPVLAQRSKASEAGLVELLKRRSGLERVLLAGFRSGGVAGLSTRSGMENRFFAVPDYEPAIPDAYRRYFDQPEERAWHGELGRGRHGPPLHELVRQLDLMSVRYYAAAGPRESAELARVADAVATRVGDATLFERKNALPRAYAVRRIEVEPDAARALERVLSPEFRPHEAAVVDAIDPAGPAARLAAPKPERSPERKPFAADRVSIASYAPEGVVLDAECAERCMVVLTDLFYPGWRATVDAAEVPVHRVNTLYRGVVLAPGPHRIRFRFSSRPLQHGVGLAVASLSVLVAITACAAWRSRMDEARET